MSAPATGLRYSTRVMEGGLTLAIAMTEIPDTVAPATLASMLVDELKARNITYGLDEAAITNMLDNRVLEEEVIIGHGTPPRSGHDAEVQLLRLPPSFMHSADERGQVDYKEVENVSEVKEGDVIARKIPSDAGEPGFNVFGREVRPPAVRDAHLPAGRNTVISEDGLELRAAKNGYLRWSGDKIDVVELYLVMGNVGPSTGNIRYQNQVEIHGDIQAGFEVTTGGDVEIFGSVDGGKVISEGGTITVRKGVMGSSEGPAVVQAQGDVQIGRARFANIQSKTGNVTANAAVENSEIRAAGDLTLYAGPAMNCIVEVGGKVDVMAITTERRATGEAEDAENQTARTGNRRKYVRAVIASSPAVELIHDDPRQSTRGVVQDLSAGGMKLRLEGRLHEGAKFRTQFKIEGIAGTMWMDAVVVRTVTPADGEQDTHRSYGIEFTQIEPAVRDAIAKYCLAEDMRQHKLTGAETRPQHETADQPVPSSLRKKPTAKQAMLKKLAGWLDQKAQS